MILVPGLVISCVRGSWTEVSRGGNGPYRSAELAQFRLAAGSKFRFGLYQSPDDGSCNRFFCLHDLNLSRFCAQYFGSVLILLLSLFSVGNQTPYFCDVSLDLFSSVLRFV
jgi:hypothetical protein